MRWHEPELSGGDRVAAPGDEDRAEPLERGLAGVPVGERKPGVAGVPGAVRVDRPRVRGRGLLRLGEKSWLPPSPSRLEERAVRLLGGVVETAP